MPDPFDSAIAEYLAQMGAVGASPLAPSQAVPAATPAAAKKKAYGFGDFFSASATVDALTGSDIGTRTKKRVADIPVVGRPLAAGFDSALSPFGLVTAAAGGPLAAGLAKAAVPGAKLAAGFLSPLVGGGKVANVLAQASVGAAGDVGSRALSSIAPEPLKPAADIIGGLVGGGINAAALAKRLPTAAAAVAPKLTGTGVEAVEKLIGLLKAAKPLRAGVEKAKTAELGSRAGEFAAALRSGGLTMESSLRARGALKGNLPTAAFDAPAQMGFTTADVDSLVKRSAEHFGINGPNFRSFDHLNVIEALNGLVMNGKLPTRGEIQNLSKVYGDDFTKALLSHRSSGEKAVANALDLLNVPRAVMSSWDISAPFNQGVNLVTRKEFWGAWQPMVKAFFDEKYAKDLMETIETRPLAARANAAKLYIADLGYGPAVGAREEAYGTRIARAVPGVAASERAYVTFLNKLRSDLFDNTVTKYERAGIPLAAGDDTAIAHWFNIASGRGTLPSHEIVDAANTVFFAPRRMASIVERMGRAFTEPIGAAADLATGRPSTYGSGWMPGSVVARREAARDLVGFVGVGMSALTLMHMAGIAEVEMDPRSTDFARARVGNTRYDPWGGMQPFVRLVAQLQSGERKNAAGDIVTADRGDVMWRQVQNKFSPLAGFISDVVSGKTLAGEEVDLTTPSGIGEQAVNRLAPLFLQNIVQAVNEDGAMAGLKTLPGATGVGVSTYTTIADTRNKLAQEAHGVPWKELTTGQQQRLEEANKAVFDKKAIQSEYGMERDAIRAASADDERAAKEASESLDPNSRISVDQYRARLAEVNTSRILKTQQAQRDFGLKFKDDDVESRFYALRDAAQTAGVVDPQQLDSLEEDFYSRLSPEDKRKVDDLREFRHAPEVQAFYDAKKTIAEAGYWDAQREAIDRFRHLLPPGAETMFDLVNAMEIAEKQGDRFGAARLKRAISTIGKATDRARKQLRRSNPQLNEALALVYGTEPLNRFSA